MTASLPDWSRLTPARKAALIVELYDPESTSATDLTIRIFKKYDQRVPRNAIIGFYARMPELRRDYPLTGTNQNVIPSSAKSDHLRQLADERRQKAAKEAEERKKTPLVAPEPIESVVARRRASLAEWAVANSRNLSLLELESGDCKWPTGSGPYTFCGCQAEEQGAYCGYHAKIAYEARRGD